MKKVNQAGYFLLIAIIVSTTVYVLLYKNIIDLTDELIFDISGIIVFFSIVGMSISLITANTRDSQKSSESNSTEKKIPRRKKGW